MRALPLNVGGAVGSDPLAALSCIRHLLQIQFFVLFPVFCRFLTTNYFHFLTRMASRFLQDELCGASARGELSHVLELLQQGAKVNGPNRFNRSALQVGKKINQNRLKRKFCRIFLTFSCCYCYGTTKLQSMSDFLKQDVRPTAFVPF